MLKINALILQTFKLHLTLPNGVYLLTIMKLQSVLEPQNKAKNCSIKWKSCVLSEEFPSIKTAVAHCNCLKV